MRVALLLPFAVLFMVLAQYFVPGRAVYHSGLYNVVIIALLVVTALWRGSAIKRAPRAAGPSLVALLGILVIGIAGAANGLFAPDDATIVGSPGASVAVPDLRGTLVFPLTTTPNRIVVRLQRAGSTVGVPASGVRFAGGFMLSQVPRPVVAIDAADASGRHLTITQPSGIAFLSPVLTFAQRQMIPGLHESVPFDSFAVPALHRAVNVVYLDPATAANLRGVAADDRSAVLFAVDDADGRALAHGVRLALDGQTVTVAGLQLTPHTLAFPAIRIVAVPLPLAAVAGLLLVAIGGLWAILGRKERSGLDAQAESR